MNAHEKLFLPLIIILSFIIGSCAIQKDSQPIAQTTIASTPANPTAIATNPPQTAMIEYRILLADLQKYFDPDRPPLELPDSEQEGRAMLVINAIYAIDKDRIFLGGRLDFPNNGNAERSVLLQSSDGGEHWTEVMQTTRVSEVEHIVFLGQGDGWALVAGAGERGASMPVMLWHTDDYGETWRIAGKIRTGSGISIVHTTLQFYNSTNGELRLTCIGSSLCKGGDYYSILSTQDSGATWQESYHLFLPYVEGDPGHEKRLVAFTLPKGGRYGSHTGSCYSNNIQECPSYGQDGSEWQAEYSQDRMNLFVRRRLSFESEWTTFILPACVEYRQGVMLGACK